MGAHPALTWHVPKTDIHCLTIPLCEQPRTSYEEGFSAWLKAAQDLGYNTTAVRNAWKGVGLWQVRNAWKGVGIWQVWG